MKPFQSWVGAAGCGSHQSETLKQPLVWELGRHSDPSSTDSFPSLGSAWQVHLVGGSLMPHPRSRWGRRHREDCYGAHRKQESAVSQGERSGSWNGCPGLGVGGRVRILISQILEEVRFLCYCSPFLSWVSRLDSVSPTCLESDVAFEWG